MSYRSLLFVAGSVLTVGLGLTLARALILRHLSPAARRTAHPMDDLIIVLLRHTRAFFVWTLALAVGAWQIPLPAPLSSAWHLVFVSLLILQGALWATAVLDFLLVDRASSASPTVATTYDFLSTGGKVVVWSLAALLVLDNIPGVEIGTLLTGLGIGGVAVALAVQNILGDLFAYLSIVLDKPFAIGDFIAVDALMGTVEHIGLRSTRLLSVSGEQLIFSNHDLVGSRIHNYGRMEKRRVTFTVGVVYETPIDKLEALPTMLKEIVEAQPGTEFEQAFLKTMGDFALIYEVIYYLMPPDYALFVRRQQAIHLAILRRCAEEGIELAYPTQTIYLQQMKPN